MGATFSIPEIGSGAPTSAPAAVSLPNERRIPLTPEQIEEAKKADRVEEAKKALKEHTEKLNVNTYNNNTMEIMNDKNRIQQYENVINKEKESFINGLNLPSPSLSTTSMNPYPLTL